MLLLLLLLLLLLCCCCSCCCCLSGLSKQPGLVLKNLLSPLLLFLDGKRWSVTVGVRGQPGVRPILRTATPDLDRRVHKMTCWSSSCAARNARVRKPTVTRCQTSDDPKANSMRVVEVFGDNRVFHSGRLRRRILQPVTCDTSASTDRQVCKVR